MGMLLRLFFVSIGSYVRSATSVALAAKAISEDAGVLVLTDQVVASGRIPPHFRGIVLSA